MEKNKKYYWLKLKEDFFRDKRMKKLRGIAGGDTYTIIYLKLQLLSIKNNGILIYDGLEDTFEEELALDIDEKPEDVLVCINYLKHCGLLEETTNGEYLLIQAIECIGFESQSAERVRRFREKKKQQKALHCNALVTKCNTEIEIEKREKRKEIEYNVEQKLDNIPYKEIIDYLNLKTNSNYRYTTNKTKSIIKARFNEGFLIDDFKKVIDNKTNDWLNDEKMKNYLRPETLFGTKFESYLNQQQKKPKIELNNLYDNYDL